MKDRNKKEEIKDKISQGDRIAFEEARELFSWDLIELGILGNIRRKQKFPREEVGFIVDRIVNFTNVCEAECSFCAYHKGVGNSNGYELSVDEILGKVEKLVRAGGTQVMLQGGLHPDYTIDNYLNLVRSIKEKFPKIYLHSFSPAELIHISRKSGISLDNALSSLKSAGLDSVPGASDLLVDRIRRMVSPAKLTKDEWGDVMRALHRNGMKSSATMTYGMGETHYERIEHLNVIRDIQDETGIIRAFIPWSFSPARTRLEEIQPASGIEYLKIVAVSRIYLDNVTYIQAGWLTEGLKLAQIALTMGANDMGGVLTEEVVVKATGVETRTNIHELIDIIKNAGKKPVKRDSEYRVIRSCQ